MVEPDFGGYATKANIKCSDGLFIGGKAFQHMHDETIPLVWQHMHDSPDNVLGHVKLEHRDDDGVYVRAFFNSTKSAKTAAELVKHGDIKAMSILANALVKKGQEVVHGIIREVSLVLAGANPGAKIDFIAIQHGDGSQTVMDDEAIITTGLTIEHSAESTVQDVYDTMNDEQKGIVAGLISAALEASGTAQHSDDKKDVVTDDKKIDDVTIVPKEGTDIVVHSVFDQTDKKNGPDKNKLSHADVKGIMADAMKPGMTVKTAVEGYAIKHGIENIEALFPDPKLLSNTPDFDSRRMAWVQGVIDGTHKTPFSRIKSLVANITMESARALGYIKGNFKKEEWFSVTGRTTTPTTIYKKQQLYRDDVVDITDFDVVAWIKAEMRMMLMEEVARAILIGDGRAIDSEDKIKDPIGATEGAGIRSIYHDHELYATTVNVNVSDANSSYIEVVEAILRAKRFYKGSGGPTFYTTEQTITEMLLTKDADGRRFWNNESDLAAAMRVSSIVAVEVMETESDLLGIIVNLSDYNVGADKGGEVSFFDDFDIDYNALKYLIETRISGALTKIKSALVIKKTAAGNTLVTPNSPTFVSSTGVVTIPSQTGVVYKNADTLATLTAGAQAALDEGETLNVLAVPATNYYFFSNAEDEWPFTRPVA